MGIPVVATDLPEIRRFNAEHGDIVVVGGRRRMRLPAPSGALLGGSTPR